MQEREGRPHPRRVRTAAVLAGLLCTLATVVAGLVTAAIVSDQQQRLLAVRTNEVKLVLETAVAATRSR